jgi:hypothetical protein
MRPNRFGAWILLAAAIALLFNTGCGVRGAVVEPVDYAGRNDDPADLYRITTTDERVFMATRIAVTDTTVVIHALQRKGDDDLLFGATRYADVTLPVTLAREDVRTLERVQTTVAGVAGDTVGVFFALLAFVLIAGAAGGGFTGGS